MVMITGYVPFHYFILVLEIDPQKPNNLNREGVINEDYALFHCLEAKIVEIYNILGRDAVDEATFRFVDGRSRLIRVGDNILARGHSREAWWPQLCIEFYLTKKACYQHYPSYRTIFRSWYKNGRRKVFCRIRYGYRYGRCRIWYDNGQLAYRCRYDQYRCPTGLEAAWDRSGNLYLLYYHGLNELRVIINRTCPSDAVTPRNMLP